jgi:hypothetical protein
MEVAVTRTFTFIIGIALCLSATAAAHHGGASFDTSREITLKGTVTEWIWANPHCFLKFDAMDDTGTVRNWAVETQNPTDMTRRGWARTSFKAGDAVTVTLQPVKNGAPVGRIRSVVLPNGETLGTGGPLPPAAGGPPAAAATEPGK